MGIVTPDRVRNRVGKKESEIGNTIVNEFITDAEARVNKYAGHTIDDPTSGEYPIAQAAVTDFAAYYCLLRDLGDPAIFTSYSLDELKIDKTDPMQNRLNLLEQMKASAEANLELLVADPVVKTQERVVLIPRDSGSR